MLNRRRSIRNPVGSARTTHGKRVLRCTQDERRQRRLDRPLWLRPLFRRARAFARTEFARCQLDAKLARQLGQLLGKLTPGRARRQVDFERVAPDQPDGDRRDRSPVRLLAGGNSAPRTGSPLALRRPGLRAAGLIGSLLLSAATLIAGCGRLACRRGLDRTGNRVRFRQGGLLVRAPAPPAPSRGATSLAGLTIRSRLLRSAFRARLQG